jgi:succinate dehydrogenase flavin-adding protein (antitoxin of CptAB toxin-antitoxin module)
MTCTRQFLNHQWEHHRWRKRVTFSEILTAPDTNMWARVVYRNYVRCDKEDVCEVCGKVRRRASCMCDMERAERCPILLAWKAGQPPAPA